MSGPLPADSILDRGRTFANAALALGVASILFLVLGFTVLPYGFDLSLFLAVISLVCGIFAFQLSLRRETRVMAVTGGLLALVPWLLFAFLVWAFEFSPGD